MKSDAGLKLMENIDKGIRAGVKKALEDHKKSGVEIVIWEKGKIKKIPASKI